jgi:hypothetical protein
MGRKRERTISAFSDDGISQVRKHITNIEYNTKINAFQKLSLIMDSAALYCSDAAPPPNLSQIYEKHTQFYSTIQSTGEKA